MAKRGRKKHSIPGQQHQHEKEAAGAGLTGDCAEKPVSQIPHQKAAINPAKRVEANDKLHFDSVAEWDADKVFKHQETLKALEQRIDLAPLIRAAESGVWEACWKLWYVAKQATYALNDIAEKHPELFHAFARLFRMAGSYISQPVRLARQPTVLGKIAARRRFAFREYSERKKGRTSSFSVLANRLAFKLYTKIETERAGHDYSKSVAEMYGLTLPSWIERAVNLEPLSAKTWRSWAETAWQILLEETNGKPEQDQILRPLGESAGKKKPKFGKELHKRTANTNVRAKIKARLFDAFELGAKGSS
jgi:hypothetical protein